MLSLSDQGSGGAEEQMLSKGRLCVKGLPLIASLLVSHILLGSLQGPGGHLC